ncbi:TetR/AcrR family transcriptional regulator [Denitrobaculum tricleocarpae]|nr:TetR/AcrR family transcriptional regulator [Denitrobaculum tricleocarpae]
MTDTKTKILDLAEHLTQTRGFNGFSYIDLGEEIGIKTASVHYYFKVKDDLAAALVERVQAKHAEGFRGIEAGIACPRKRLEAVVAHFQGYVKEEKFCLCGMMAAELQSVSPRVASLVKAYFDAFQAWLTQQFKEAGYKDAKLQALSFLSALEGALLIARLRRDPKIIHHALKGFLKV